MKQTAVIEDQSQLLKYIETSFFRRGQRYQAKFDLQLASELIECVKVN